MHKVLAFDMYTIDPSSRRFKSLFNERIISDVFTFLASENSVQKMIQTTKHKRPAMEGIIEALENEFTLNDFDIEHNYKFRQITGSMIRYIMGHYGYTTSHSKKLVKGHYIKTAILYKAD